MEEIKKKLFESIVNEILDDPELINKADNGLTLQDALKCIKQYEKRLQNQKRKITNIGYEQAKTYISWKSCKDLASRVPLRLN